MSNIKNTKLNIVFYALGLLAVSAFGVMIIPVSALADYGQNYTFGTPNGYSNYNSYNLYNQNAYQTPVYTPAPAPAPAPTPTIYSDSANSNAAATTSAPKRIAKAKVSPVKIPVVNSNTYSGLTANAFYGSNSFFPSGLMGWTLLAIFILLLVILTRKVFGADKKYHSTPMKHA